MRVLGSTEHEAPVHVCPRLLSAPLLEPAIPSTSTDALLGDGDGFDRGGLLPRKKQADR